MLDSVLQSSWMPFLVQIACIFNDLAAFTPQGR